MKLSYARLALLLLQVMLLVMLLVPPIAAAPRKSLLDNDPDVIYLNEHIKQTIILIVDKPADVYTTKKGGRRLGTFKTGTKIELLAMTDKAYRVKGQTSHGGVAGWVDPRLLSSEDENFIANLKLLYQRQMLVNELIAKKDVAIGMMLSEVRKSLGEPTETEVRQTKKGESGKWDYVVNEEQKHYRQVIDPNTRQIFRQLSHVTMEEKSRITLEFENDIVTAITRKENKGRGKVLIVPAPIIFHW